MQQISCIKKSLTFALLNTLYSFFDTKRKVLDFNKSNLKCHGSCVITVAFVFFHCFLFHYTSFEFYSLRKVFTGR